MIIRSLFTFLIALGCLGFPYHLDARIWSESTTGVIDGMSYRYFLPSGYDSSKEYPLVLFLHGSGESGTDNLSHVRPHISGLIDKTYSDYPAILVTPQLPQSFGWSPYQPIDKTGDLLDLLVNDLSVDTNRLYVTGLSMGGFGSMEYLQRYNGEEISDLKFAAAAPLSGASISTSREGVPEKIREIPIWLAHGSNDGAVNVSTSKNTFSVLADLDSPSEISFSETLLGGPTAIVGNLRYTELVGSGHNIWSPIYKNEEFYDWMFAQSLAVPEPSTALLGIILGVSLGLNRKQRIN